MRKAGEDGTVICMHAENGIVIDEIVKSALAEGKTDPKWHAFTRPTRMEAEGVHRSIAIAEVANVPVYIVHLSSADALEQVVLARDRGIHAFAETCPQYLFLDHSYYEQEGFEGAKYVMTPPLREKWNQDELWRGLQMGDLMSISNDPTIKDKTHPILYSGTSIGYLRKVINTLLFLFLITEWTVVGGNGHQVTHLQSSPKFILVPLFPEGWCHYIFCPFKPLLLVIRVIEKKVLWTGFSKSVNTPVSCQYYLFQSIGGR
jgi:hypothetical protein